ncbi:MAG TPA: glycosyl-4,4'-diaponeurosporenoate acyltransferase [Verrucomicrobiota bacterium]|nr:glycosyl-4,4'-diaponeurosporenoate acyltransferase [Verrucomicrobiota bacterium]
MPIELPIGWVIVLNVAGWPAIQIGLAWAFTRMPAAWFNTRNPRGWEEGGRVYERIFAVKRWKDRLPDGARWFGGGFAKGRLRSADPGHLRRFVRETWRGELCHWAALAFVPVFFLWNPWWANLVIVAYAAAANVPCIVAQRYNRARFQRALARKPHAGP